MRGPWFDCGAGEGRPFSEVTGCWDLGGGLEGILDVD
jgi:hypothetical protein